MKPAPKTRTGPKTERGRDRSSANAVSHGLRSVGVLLPGEDEAEYVAHLEAVVVGLAPIGQAETHAAAMIADLQWRQRRWLRALDVATADDLEKRVKQTPEPAAVVLVDGALVVVKEMMDALEGSDGDLPDDAVNALVSGVNAMLPVLREAEHPRTTNVAALRVAVDALDCADGGHETGAAVATLREAGGAVHKALGERAEDAKHALEKVERLLAASAVPGGDDAKGLARYGRLIDVAVESQLRVLDALQQRRQRAERRPKGKPKSFGQGLAPPELRLRIVR